MNLDKLVVGKGYREISSSFLKKQKIIHLHDLKEVKIIDIKLKETYEKTESSDPTETEVEKKEICFLISYKLKEEKNYETKKGWLDGLECSENQKRELLKNFREYLLTWTEKKSTQHFMENRLKILDDYLKQNKIDLCRTETTDKNDLKAYLEERQEIQRKAIWKNNQSFINDKVLLKKRNKLKTKDKNTPNESTLAQAENNTIIPVNPFVKMTHFEESLTRGEKKNKMQKLYYTMQNKCSALDFIDKNDILEFLEKMEYILNCCEKMEEGC